MSNKMFKKIISMILVILLLAVPAFSVIASAEETEKYPKIHVPGIMASDVYIDTQNPDEGLAWPPSAQSILKLVADCVPALLEFSVTRNWEKLGHTISPLAYELFEPAMCDPDGNITNGSGTVFEYPTVERLQENPDSTFKYDWRADPVRSAAELNDYINYVLEATDSEKVSIDCHSLGGVVTVAYCSIYGYDKIDALAFNSSAVFGESYTGDLLCGDMVLTNDSLMAYMEFAYGASKAEELLSKIFDILECAGLGEFVADLASELLKNLSHIIIPEVVVPLFAGWLTIWAMVPDDMIDEAMDFSFSNYIEDNEDGTALKAKIENYNNLVRKNKTQTLLDIDENCKLGVIARYGYSSIPATSSWQQNSDGVIDTKNASFGARVSLYRSTLDEDIISSTDPEFISPDKTVDASTCLFPDKTWFIKKAKHSDNYDDLDNLVKAILFSDEEITVDSYEEFPRFMIYDVKSDRIIPDTGSEIKTEQTGIFGFFEKIKEFFADILYKLRSLFGIR